MDAAVAKARLGMAATGSRLGHASEGTFGPAPALPFITAATELVVFVDDDRGIIVGQAVTDYTVVTVTADVRPGDHIDNLLVGARFGEHGLIVRPTTLSHGHTQRDPRSEHPRPGDTRPRRSVAGRARQHRG